jgi:hypothetical protein
MTRAARARRRVQSMILLMGLFSASCRGSKGSAQPAAAPLIDLLAPRQVETRAETRRIVFGEGDRRHLLDGWSIDEHDPVRGLSFVWATALEASVSFEVIQVEDEQFLVTLSAFPTPAPQRIAVAVNDHEVFRFTAQTIFLEYRFVVRAGDLHRGTNRLTFRHSGLGKPGDAAPESRSFAAAYHSILIGPQCLPLRGFGLPPPPAVKRLGGRIPSPLVATGPAAIFRRLVVPTDSVLRLRLSLPARSSAAAVATLRLRERERVKELRMRLARPWLGGTRTRDMEVDLSAWAGKTIDLELEIGPEPCRASVATVTIQKAAVFSAYGDAHPG